EGAAIDVRLIRWSTRQTWEGQVNGRVLALSDSNVEVPADPSPKAPPTPVGSTLARHAKGSIEMTVPSHWSDVASFAHTRFDDVPGHALVAAADSEAFNVRYGEP